MFKTNTLSSRIGIPPSILFLIVSFLALFIFSMLAPVLFPMNLATTSLVTRLKDPTFIDSTSPYIFGTDNLGRDVAIRLVYAIRMSFSISLVGMIIATLLGTLMGVLGGLLGGVVDLVISFLVDAQLSIPTTFIGIVCATIFGANERTMILVIGLTGWSGFSRLVRGQIIQLKEESFIESSRAMGASQVRIFFEHILVNIASPLIVQATLSLSAFILLESSLSYLGLGIQPPNTSLGVMVSVGRDYLLMNWWLAIIPSTVIVIIILQVSLVGDWLRDKLDPKLQNKS
jgi:peptide/nickel transport system permease protein